MSQARNKDTGFTFRQSMSGLHTWIGLLPSWILYFIFITGTAGYFNTEITEWMQPEQPFAGEPPSQAEMLRLAERRLHGVGAGANEWYISFPDQRNSFLQIEWERHFSAAEKAAMAAKGLSEAEIEVRHKMLEGKETLNPQTGLPLILSNGSEEVRDTGGGNTLYRMHYVLHYLPGTLARWIVILCTLLMLVALVTGIVVHKKIFKDFFTFRPDKGQRSWLDAHNLFSVLSLPFQLMITYSGLLFFFRTIMPLLFFVPLAFTGLDTADALSAGGVDKMSAKNQALIKLISEEVFNKPKELAPAGEVALLTPLVPLLAQIDQLNPDKTVRFITVDNVHDANARVTMHYPGEITNSRSYNVVFNGVNGKRIQEASDFRAQVSALTGVRQAEAVMLNLHEGRFAPSLLRWLYFLSGLMGAGMIATGSILWVAKRRKKAYRPDYPHKKGVVLVESLNVGTVVGLPAAVAVYFWANRLIPAEMPGRADWEMHALFIAWGLLFVHAVIRRAQRHKVWIEQLWIAAASYALLPLLNVFTSSRHLGVSLVQGDWIMAGFDLTVLVIGLACGFAAYRAQRSADSSKTGSFPSKQTLSVAVASTETRSIASPQGK